MTTVVSSDEMKIKISQHALDGMITLKNMIEDENFTGEAHLGVTSTTLLYITTYLDTFSKLPQIVDSNEPYQSTDLLSWERLYFDNVLKDNTTTGLPFDALKMEEFTLILNTANMLECPVLITSLAKYIAGMINAIPCDPVDIPSQFVCSKKIAEKFGEPFPDNIATYTEKWEAHEYLQHLR